MRSQIYSSAVLVRVNVAQSLLVEVRRTCMVIDIRAIYVLRRACSFNCCCCCCCCRCCTARESSSTLAGRSTRVHMLLLHIMQQHLWRLLSYACIALCFFAFLHAALLSKPFGLSGLWVLLLIIRTLVCIQFIVHAIVTAALFLNVCDHIYHTPGDNIWGPQKLSPGVLHSKGVIYIAPR